MTDQPRAVLLCPDLLFGSKVEGFVRAADCEVEVVTTAQLARTACAKGAALLVVDLTDESYGGIELVTAMRAGSELRQTATLGFYAHTEEQTRQRAEAAGFDLIVPRSRMMREGSQLVSRLIAPS